MWQQAVSIRTGEGWGDGWGAFCVQACPGLSGCWGRSALTAYTVLIGRKVCYHHGNNAEPEERDCPTAFSDIQDVQILSRFVRDHLPDLHPEPAIMEHCMYTVKVWAAGPGPLTALENKGKRQTGLALLRPNSIRPLTLA